MRCFIDIGCATTKVVIAQGHEMVFAKTIHAAGEHLTNALAEARNLGFDEARSARIDGTHEETLSAPAVAPSDESPTGRERRVTAIEHRATGLAMLDTATEEEKAFEAKPAPVTTGGRDDTREVLIDELRLCLRHYQTLAPDHPVDRLVFLGGEAHDTKACRQIAKAVKVAAQVGDPFARMVRIGGAKHAVGLNLDEPQPGWAVPFGLSHSEANL